MKVINDNILKTGNKNEIDYDFDFNFHYKFDFLPKMQFKTCFCFSVSSILY